MLAVITAAIIASTNAPLTELREMPVKSYRRAEVSGSAIVERKKFLRVQAGKTNEYWKAGRQFPVMFISPSMRKKVPK